MTAGHRYRWVAGWLRVWLDTRPTRVLLLIMLFAVALGVAKLWLDRPNPEFNWENRWWQIALNVAHGNGYVACKPEYFPFCGPTNQVTAMREPLPVLLFAVVARLTRDSLFAAAATGVLVNIGVVVAVYYLAKELADSLTALLAALLWTVYLAPIRLLYSQVSGDLLATLGMTLGITFLLRARRTDRSASWIVAGMWIGVAILSRSSIFFVALILTIGTAIWPYSDATVSVGSRIRKLRPAMLFAVAWTLILAPWIVRNYVAFDRPVVGSTLSGYYLYRQSSALPTDDYLRFVTGAEFETVIQDMIERRPDLTGTENEAEMDAVYREEALRVIRGEPLRYIILSAYRFGTLWFNWGVNAAYGQRNTAGDYLIMIQHALLLGAGIVGLRGRWRRAWPIAVSVGALSLLYMAVHALVTYIIPVMPLLVALSAITCARLARWHLLPRCWIARIRSALEQTTG